MTNLYDEPEGWHRLKGAAQEAPDARSLALIINEMNRMLDHHQRKAEDERQYEPVSEIRHLSLALEVQTLQYD